MESYEMWLCLNQKITSPEGTLPRPYIRAVSSSVVPKRAEVSFYCQGPQGRKTFQLWKEKQLMLQINTSKEEVRFHRAIKSTSATENYSCRYFQDSHWSEFSTPLQLVVTGFFSPPKLQVQPGTVVAVGETVTFVCQVSGRSNLKKLTFFLLKAGVAGPVQQQNLEVKMANFTLPSVKAEDAGNYSCVCLVLEGKKRASDPSEVLRLEVTGKKTAHPQRQGKKQRQTFQRWEAKSPYLPGFKSSPHCSLLEDGGDAWEDRCRWLEGCTGGLAMAQWNLGNGRLFCFRVQNPPHCYCQLCLCLPPPPQPPGPFLPPSLSHPTQPSDSAGSPPPLCLTSLPPEKRMYEDVSKGRRIQTRGSESEDPQGVTYSQLNTAALDEAQRAPTSVPPEPSVYATLALH
ncbi:leukocyte immunoglobulin-like receptor subfamily B member 4 isoform X2 [Trichosurus vulpecula]|uniref:leukocyte immunoglobulin-like receptor subfamily B member 4 isoform X2 n=1 Tax=Trichosurus vulpecula TaxID=9337 RepID=UPI00186B3CC2|nr:leukocyte immunoglobulin-like receptor subfamily B member 4 isoform X2 [Trichosurus vulpecula]